MRAITFSGCVLAKCRREDYVRNALEQAVFSGKLARELVILAASDYELHLIMLLQRLKILDPELAAFARFRTLHIHDLDNFSRNILQRSFAAGLNQNRKTLIDQPPH